MSYTVVLFGVIDEADVKSGKELKSMRQPGFGGTVSKKILVAIFGPPAQFFVWTF
ncbi:hypothetical protein NL418_013740 [Escherichia coli]|nr:hypothetical protein [Escherichia coli]WCQ51542.1 hypothetical protein NL418_013740 [Escherichia coli]